MPKIDHPTFLDRVHAILAPAHAEAGPLPEGGLQPPSDDGVQEMTHALGPEGRPLLAVAGDAEPGLARTCRDLDAAIRDGSLDVDITPEETVRGSIFVYPVV
ncbi:hypothetical protein [Jannaschia seohaensis]|uniref:Uncharacterized protein n=1 Tax=Jannaschia seohaensis TaxID=475081 RepID=A0A2Y9AYY8_9RHOB|nr:hypothetical protein [Jannaschia seohaensis]PWJ15803.1 hypothetical protein BCF38_11023 [Jannaschia seohaensis]SSA49494.1 hypothetical protein SAMN05421539_11023 [Jannaschia seohaensis]